MTKLSAYRRTWKVGLAVGAVTVATFLATAPGSAAPGQAEEFNAGTGRAVALGYKVNPTNGNLSFGITAGESIAGHQNTGATGQSRAINLGVIGVTLAAEKCDGDDPTWPEEDQPQPVIARSGEDGAEEGKRENEAETIEKFARATPAPFAEAVTTIAPMGDPAAVYVSGGRTVTHSGVIDGQVREALARTELARIVIGGGALELRSLKWEAIHRSGAVEETIGTFDIGGLFVGGEAVALPSDTGEAFAQINELLSTVGLTLTPPQVRVEEGIVFVDPLKVGIVQHAERDGLVGPIFSAIQPVRESLTEALIDIDCGNATYITVADIVLGSFSGAGELTLELGGVQATTAELDAFQFPALPPLPELPPTVGGVADLGVGSAPSGSSLGSPAATPPAAETGGNAGGSQSTEQRPTQPVADLTGDRGGLLALVGGGGLAALLGTAEADRRKMRRAMREIPLEA